jgi:hypothetical protein
MQRRTGHGRSFDWANRANFLFSNFNILIQSCSDDEECATMSHSKAAMAPSPLKALASVAEALDYACTDTIAELANFASSYWRSIAEAAIRGDHLTIAVHLRQVGAINREVKALVETLGTVDVPGDGQP